MRESIKSKVSRLRSMQGKKVQLCAVRNLKKEVFEGHILFVQEKAKTLAFRLSETKLIVFKLNEISECRALEIAFGGIDE